jgi:hypothetical protein
MFTGSLTEEVKLLEDDIEAVKDKVDDAVMCEKIRQFVNAPRDIHDMFRADAGAFVSLLLLVTLLDLILPHGSLISGRKNQHFRSHYAIG